jgi:Asp-tRNA(Asn)/Glu-tRNA(Gln) amidotransferase A subunit family amidase
MAPDVRGASLTTLAAGVAAKTWKSRDLVEAYLDRIARLDNKLGCFLLLDSAGARRGADAIDRKIAAGESVGTARRRAHRAQGHLRHAWDRNHSGGRRF